MRKLIICVVLAALLFTGCAPAGTAPAGSASVQASQQVTEPGAQERPASTVSGKEPQPSSLQSELPAETEAVQMTAMSSGIKDGVIDAKYGHSNLSLPVEISGAPEGTVCFALYMDDPDAVPVCGYRFVHWMAVNIKDNALPEDFSRQAGNSAVQGRSDFGDTGYGGPAPPDKDHTYEITIYALDSELALSEGFSKDDFSAAVEGHTLAKVTLAGLYKK